MNPATRADINRWLDRLYADENLTHMIVMCDTFDWSDYPVYVTRGQDPREVAAEKVSSMNTLMEVYSHNHTREEQMAEYRAFHYD